MASESSTKYELKILASTLAHEIRNPLQVIKLQIEAALRKQVTPTTLQSISEQVSRVENVVERVQRLSERYRLTPQSINLQTLVSKTLDSVRYWLSAAGVRVVEQVHWEGDPICVCDAELLEQVLLNLVMNAIQAMPEGGVLTLSLSESIDYAEIEVNDTGVGMDAETKSLVGTPFFTTKDQGTGLGVSFCKTIAALHGGSVEFESQEGQGTKATLKILKNVSEGQETRHV